MITRGTHLSSKINKMKVEILKVNQENILNKNNYKRSINL